MRFALVLSLCVLTILCGVTGSAWAVPVTWTLHNVVFQDGATVSGSFVYDADTNTYSAVNITTTTGPIRTGATYTFVCTTPCDLIAPSDQVVAFLTTSPATDQTGLPVLQYIFFNAPLTNAGAKTIAVLAGEASCVDTTCSDGEDPIRFGGGLITSLSGAIPTLSEWGMIVLVLSLLTVGTWQLAGRPMLLHAGTAGGLVLRAPSRRLLEFVLVGQVVACVGLGLYASLIKPLLPQDLVGALLAGVVLGVLLECYRRGRER
jgi:hypothetical protein